ncbi:MAG TPA: vWA domain-containing protein [Phycisphaerales bacterium]|nr:vWA domain-containing protein [Phycisphaerales bacterium]
MVTTLPWLVALAAIVLAGLGEWLHARRTARVARLVFGPTGAPSRWVAAAPYIRVAGIAAAAWGATVLAAHDPMGGDQTPAPRASKQVLIALDVSPSMLIKDAGPDAEKVSRSRWAGKVVQGVLDRLDMKQTRISLVAFYTKAMTVLTDSTDKNVIANMFDGLQLHVAFDPGPTDLASGVTSALQIARPWARRSTTLIVISDGDAKSELGQVTLPPAIADVIVIGVGDPNKATVVSGHSSRQETLSLKTLAARLEGTYHEGNRLHLPSGVLKRLSMISPNAGGDLGLRDAGLIALGAGSAVTALVTPALMLLGLKRSHARERRVAHAAPSRLATGAAS